METYFVGGTLIDCTGNEPRNNSIVGIKGSLITCVGNEKDQLIQRDSTNIDIKGKYIMPGLINMHEHLTYKKAKGSPFDILRQDHVNLTIYAVKTCINDLRSGITTIREMGAQYGIAFSLREAIKRGNLIGPRIITCGQPISATGGHFSQIAVVADGPDEVRKEARRLLSLGADFIKVMASHDPYLMPGREQTRAEMTIEEIQAAYEEAHKWGKSGACHAIGSAALENVIRAGVDIIDHGAYMDENTAEVMANKGIYFTPTLSSYTKQTINSIYGRGEEWITKHMPLIQPFIDAFGNAMKARVKIVCGTDSVGRYAEEIDLFRQYGMQPMESLLSCTKIPAEALGIINKIGTVETNKQADLIILNDNPLEDAFALEKISWVVKDGILYNPGKLNLIM